MADQQIWVFSEKPALLAEMIAGAHTLIGDSGGTITAIVLGARTEADQAAAHGADKIIWLGEEKTDRMVEDYVPTLAQLFQDHTPTLVLIGSTRRGRAVAGRLAARLGVTVLTDVLEFLSDGGEMKIRHMIFGGGAVREEKPLAQPVLATVVPGVFAARSAETGRQAEIVEAAFAEPEWRVTVRERKTRAAASVNLAVAKKVVCPGRGVAQKEDLAMVNELAQVLGAEIACTRPLAEGLDWLPRERYIGISGATIKADLYLGVGVSGQVQHVIGMGNSRVVVAINKDQNAPIFAQADYGIVGDLYEVVPALIQALKARK
jgi:electron transfer flavoprotein alpha subunit